MATVVSRTTSSATVRVVPSVIGALLAALVLLCAGPLLRIPDDINAILTMLLGLALTIVHGRLSLGWKRLAAFVGITVVISFSAEALGVATGLIFGPYHYTDHLGPKLLGVPLLIQAAYVAMGYASFMMARVLLGTQATPRGRDAFFVTLCTAMIMVAWDVAMDPYQSTISGDWIWEQGGAYFGVPLHNYVGWFATVALFTFAYLQFETRHPLSTPNGPSQTPFVSSVPILYYALVGLGNVLTPHFETIDSLAAPANYTGSISAMTGSLTLITIFVMGTPVAIALSRIVMPSRTTGMPG